MGASAPVGVRSGSGSHGPTYVSRRARADVISFTARFVTVFTRYGTGDRTAPGSVADHRSQASCTMSSASATLPVMR